jgi:hypothetical protein
MFWGDITQIRILKAKEVKFKGKQFLAYLSIPYVACVLYFSVLTVDARINLRFSLRVATMFIIIILIIDDVDGSLIYVYR